MDKSPTSSSAAPLHRSGLNRNASFAFSCSQCIQCCRGKNIQVNPYEIARLSENRNMSTTEFISCYTNAGATLLNWNNEDTCVFLAPAGCIVHKDRPLVCRLYPLGRHINPDGEESFSEMQPDIGCRGIYSDHGSISEYLDAQGAGPFIDAADRYLNLFRKLLETLKRDANKPAKRDAVVEVLQNRSSGFDFRSCHWMDMDATVAAFCRERGLSFPDDVMKKMSFHIQAIEAWLQP